MSMKKISIAGSTGSVGSQAVDVALEMGLNVCSLSAGSDWKTLEKQCRMLRPDYAAMHSEDAARQLREALADTDIRVFSGEKGVCEAAAAGDTVLNAVTGSHGLRISLTAAELGKTLALANKESLVMAGELLMPLARRNGCDILPVDSEHSAVFQSLRAGEHEEIEKIILTASGGPFFGRKDLEGITPEMALRHPSWDMGAHITIDSATLVNKGFEVIEACWLFNVSPEQIEVVVHRQSIVHSMVSFRDGSVIAQLSCPDMRHPIQYALTHPHRMAAPRKKPDFMGMDLTFAAPDRKLFRGIDIALDAYRRGSHACSALVGANQGAVRLFLEKKIGFSQIYTIIENAVNRAPSGLQTTAESIIAAAEDAEKRVLSEVK